MFTIKNGNALMRGPEGLTIFQALYILSDILRFKSDVVIIFLKTINPSKKLV